MDSAARFELSEQANVIFFNRGGKILMDERIIHLRNIPYRSILEQYVYFFVDGLVKGISGFAGKTEVTAFFGADMEAFAYLFQLAGNISRFKRSGLYPGLIQLPVEHAVAE